MVVSQVAHPRLPRIEARFRVTPIVARGVHTWHVTPLFGVQFLIERDVFYAKCALQFDENQIIFTPQHLSRNRQKPEKLESGQTEESNKLTQGVSDDSSYTCPKKER